MGYMTFQFEAFVLDSSDHMCFLIYLMSCVEKKNNTTTLTATFKRYIIFNLSMTSQNLDKL